MKEPQPASTTVFGFACTVRGRNTKSKATTRNDNYRDVRDGRWETITMSDARSQLYRVWSMDEGGALPVPHEHRTERGRGRS